MTTFRGLFVRKDATRGTSPVEARKALAGLLQRLNTGAPRQGLLMPVQVVGTASWAYSVPAAAWATSRSAADGVVLSGNDGVVSVPTDPAPASGSRIDVLYVLHRDVDNADPDSESVIGIAKGAASGSPVAPSIPAGAMEIARATVSAGQANTLAATITQTATYTGLAGADITVPISAGASPYAALDAVVPSAPNGTRVFSVADATHYVRAAGAWHRTSGDIGSALLNGSASGIAALTRVTGLDTPAVTVAGRTYRIELSAQILTSVASARQIVQIRRGTTATSPLVATSTYMPSPVAATASGITLVGRDTPGAGAQTYTVWAQLGGGGGTCDVRDQSLLTVSIA